MLFICHFYIISIKVFNHNVKKKKNSAMLINFCRHVDAATELDSHLVIVFYIFPFRKIDYSEIQGTPKFTGC